MARMKNEILKLGTYAPRTTAQAKLEVAWPEGNEWVVGSWTIVDTLGLARWTSTLIPAAASWAIPSAIATQKITPQRLVSRAATRAIASQTAP